MMQRSFNNAYETRASRQNQKNEECLSCQRYLDEVTKCKSQIGELKEKLNYVERQLMLAQHTITQQLEDKKSVLSDNQDTNYIEVFEQYLDNPTNRNLYLVEKWAHNQQNCVGKILEHFIEGIRKSAGEYSNLSKKLKFVTNTHTISEIIKGYNKLALEYYKQTQPKWSFKKQSELPQEVQQNIILQVTDNLSYLENCTVTSQDSLLTHQKLENEKLQNQLAEIKDELLLKEGIIANLKDHSQNVDKEIDIKRKENNVLIEELSKHKANISDLKSKNSKYLKTLEEKQVTLDKQKHNNTLNINKLTTEKKTLENLQLILKQENDNINQEIRKTEHKYKELLGYNSTLKSQKDSEIEAACNRIQELNQTKYNFLNFLQRATDKYRNKINAFTQTVNEYTHTVPIEQLRESAARTLVNIKINKIEDIQRNIETHESDIQNCRRHKDQKEYLHINEILIRALESLDNVESNGNIRIKDRRGAAIFYVQKLYDKLQEHCYYID